MEYDVIPSICNLQQNSLSTVKKYNFFLAGGGGGGGGGIDPKLFLLRIKQVFENSSPI